MKTATKVLQTGFTLIEVAIVLTIITLLLTGALIPLSGAIESAKVKQTTEYLREDVTRALFGYAASRVDGPYLPCPDCPAACAGGTPNDGQEDRIAATGRCVLDSARPGNLPWATLGVDGADPWGGRYSYRVMPAFAASSPAETFSLGKPNLGSSTRDLLVRERSGGDYLVGKTEGAAAVLISHGRNRYGAVSEQGVVQPSPPPGNIDELENLDDDREFVSRPIAYRNNLEEFDDIVTWVSAHQLRGFMIEAGRLP
jgi:prepilin-type N-terminal cleavage/methylation domain-containing protein